MVKMEKWKAFNVEVKTVFVLNMNKLRNFVKDYFFGRSL